MTDDDLLRLVEQLHQDEGLRLKPYTDTVGKLTIGYGRNLTDRGITYEEADYLLSNDIEAAESDARRVFPWFAMLDSVRQAAIVNLCFNLGVTKLIGFEHALKAMSLGDYARAAEAFANSKWRVQVGQRAVELCQQIRTGEWA